MKIAGSYASLLRGVSQQPAEVRSDGQHTAQVNMLPDPVQGLTRRRGTVFQHGSFVPVNGTPPFDAAGVEATGTGYRKIEHRSDGTDYVILLRDYPQGGAFPGDSMPPVMCYNKSTKAFIGVSWSVSGGSWESTTRANGIAAAVSIGQYIVWAPRYIPCSLATTAKWGTAGTKKGVVWIRGGTYARTFTVMVNGGSYSFTTPTSSAAVTPSAEQQIQPSYIAQQLASVLSANGFTGVQNVGSHLCFDLPSSGDVATSDGGDGGLMRGVGLLTNAVDKLPLMGINGMVVKVQPSADAWFYMQAYGRANSGTTLQEVVWRECAGESQGTTLTGLGMGRIYNDTLYIGVTNSTDPTGLGHMSVSDNPTLLPSFAGDAKLNPPHRWMNNYITYLGVFQDRLLVGSGAALSVSAAGDYLNFFRSTMTTVPVSDGFEVVPQGGEDDVLRHSVTYNRNLVIFGDKRQYMVPGTVPFSPTAPNMSIMTVYSQAADCPPVAAGGQIYYARNKEGWASIHQIQPGQYVDSAESFPASAQVTQYIPAPAVEIEPIAGVPAMLAVRSRSDPHSVYIFSYVDLPDGRKQDAWFKLEFNSWCGQLMAMHSTVDGLLLFWARRAQNNLVYRVADLLPWSTANNDKPFLDSMRTRSSVGETWPGNNGVFYGDTDWCEAFDNSDASNGRFLQGAAFDAQQAMFDLENMPEAATKANLWVGLPFDAYVKPTNPYPRDSAGKAITTGRTTVTKLVVHTKDSAGMAWDVTTGGVTRTGAFIGRVMGSLFNIIGKVPITTSLVSVPIGRETRAYDVKLKARYWYPLNIVGVEWVGQSFNRTPRGQQAGG